MWRAPAAIDPSRVVSWPNKKIEDRACFDASLDTALVDEDHLVKLEEC